MSDPIVLPDSRLINETLGSVMIDWTFDGVTQRIEVVPIFCPSCGKDVQIYVPKENMVGVTYICRECLDKYGATLVPGLVVMSDHEFCLAVQHEMRERFGRDLSDRELFQLKEQGQLGRELELLERESPFPCSTNRPKGRAA